MREMTRAQKIRAFNESNAPFYLVDHTDEVSLCCVFHPMPDSVFSLGQEAFNRYAERIGDPVKDEYGLFTHGSGYEWEYVFRKAFENDPNIGKVSFDCEAGGFFCYGESVDMMADFGRRFRQILNDTDSLTELICKAVPEGEQREAELEQLRSTVRGFLMEHPKATVDLVTPEGYLRLTPEDGKALLDGKPAQISSGVSGFACGVDADILLDMQIGTCAQERSDENRFFIMAEPPMEESEDFCISTPGKKPFGMVREINGVTAIGRTVTVPEPLSVQLPRTIVITAWGTVLAASWIAMDLPVSIGYLPIPCSRNPTTAGSPRAISGGQSSFISPTMISDGTSR